MDRSTRTVISSSETFAFAFFLLFLTELTLSLPLAQLPFNCQWQELKDLMRGAGSVLRADIAQGPDGRSRGFGSVLFATSQDAERAVGMFNGFEFNGRGLKVRLFFFLSRWKKGGKGADAS
jgi:RNA recognition motif-containing protein